MTMIFLDAGGVLFDAQRRHGQRIADVLRARGYGEDDVAKGLAAGDAVGPGHAYEGHWMTTWADEEHYWRSYYGAVAQALSWAPEGLAEELAHLCLYVQHMQAFPEVRSVLEHLQARYRLAVISNAYPSMDWVFDRLDLRRYFEHITLSAYAGCRKPDEGIYRQALAAMQCSPGQAIFVDDLLPNIQAARAIGMTALHLVRASDSAEGDLHDLAELVEWVGNR